MVSPVGVTGAEAAAPRARGIAAVDPLAMAAPKQAGAPLVRAIAAAWPPDLAVPVVGASPPARTPAAAGRRSDRADVLSDACAARPACEAAVSFWRTTRSARGVVIVSVGTTPVDCEDGMITASEYEGSTD